MEKTKKILGYRNISEIAKYFKINDTNKLKKSLEKELNEKFNKLGAKIIVENENIKIIGNDRQKNKLKKLKEQLELAAIKKITIIGNNEQSLKFGMDFI